MNHYHESIQVPEDLRKQYEEKAINQEKFALGIYRIAPQGLTRWELSHILNRLMKLAPSSIGRIVSNLYRDNYILDSGDKRKGDYGHENTVYIFNPNPDPTKVRDVRKNLRFTDDQLAVIKSYFQKGLPNEKDDTVAKIVTQVLEMLK